MVDNRSRRGSAQMLHLDTNLSHNTSFMNQKDVVSVNSSGVRRMNKDWRHKLWVEFDRDRKLETLYKNIDEDEIRCDFQELRLDNHSATEEYM